MDSENEDKEKESVKKSKKKKNDGTFDLKRPIIFICNDLWVKALKPLRDLSIQVKIPEADPKRLIQRMRQIVRLEGLKIDEPILQELQNQSGGDTRSAINGLQFMAMMQSNNPDYRLSLEEYRQKCVAGPDVKQGSKDVFTNVF